MKNILTNPPVKPVERGATKQPHAAIPLPDATMFKMGATGKSPKPQPARRSD